jgi:hypothetical protein
MTTLLLAFLLTMPPADSGLENAPVAAQSSTITGGAVQTPIQTTGKPYRAASTPNWVQQGRDFAKTWGMHQIAVIQAGDGDYQAAKRTLSQIGDDGEKIPADVTGVWFCNGLAIYDHPPGRWLGPWPLAGLSPPGLPPNYLAPDPRRGAVVKFIDERDSRGTRVTSRTYANGSIVIETPQSNGRP